jgi:uncharacterized protein YxjI
MELIKHYMTHSCYTVYSEAARLREEGTRMRYAMREKFFSIGDDFWITGEQGNRVFLADGKALRLRQTVELPAQDTYGVETAPGQDDVLLLAVAVALDRIHHDEEQRR